MAKVESLQEILLNIQSNADQIKNYGVVKIGVFGSFVRGEQTDRSDIVKGTLVQKVDIP